MKMRLAAKPTLLTCKTTTHPQVASKRLSTGPAALPPRNAKRSGGPRAKATFDFEGDANEGELSFFEGDTIYLNRKINGVLMSLWLENLLFTKQIRLVFYFSGTGPVLYFEMDCVVKGFRNGLFCHGISKWVVLSRDFEIDCFVKGFRNGLFFQGTSNGEGLACVSVSSAYRRVINSLSLIWVLETTQNSTN
jgi:hypothetical protein